MSRVLMFSNIKGGVGKTTFAYLTAASLPVFLNRPMKILAVDLDPQANLTDVLFGGDKSLLLQANIQHFFEDNLPLEKCIVPSRIDHVDLAPSQIGLSMVEQTILYKPMGTLALRYGLCSLKDKYDLIVIDAPPSLGLLTMNGLIAADIVVCPVSPDTMALEGFKYLSTTFNKIVESPVGEGKKLLLILNLIDHRYALHRAFEGAVKNSYRDKVIATISRRSAIHRAFELKEEDPWNTHIVNDQGALEDVREFFLGLSREIDIGKGAPGDDVEEKEEIRE